MSTQYLLDTNICIYIAKHQLEIVRQRFSEHAAQDLFLSVITLGELRYGAEKSQAKTKALKVINELTSMIQVVELNEKVAIHYAEIRSDLAKKGTMIGNNDLWLAAHARANQWTMVTNNEEEFIRVKGLNVENWTK